VPAAGGRRAAGAADEPLLHTSWRQVTILARAVEPRTTGQHGRAERAPVIRPRGDHRHPDRPHRQRPGRDQHASRAASSAPFARSRAAHLRGSPVTWAGVQGVQATERHHAARSALAVDPRRDGAGVPAGDRAVGPMEAWARKGRCIGGPGPSSTTAGLLVWPRLNGTSSAAGEQEKEPLQVGSSGGATRSPAMGRLAHQYGAARECLRVRGAPRTEE